MDRLKKIRAKFRFSKSFAIIGHVDPDGDAICSALAFAQWIELNYKKAVVHLFFDGNIPGIFEPYLNGRTVNKMPTKDYSTVIVLDSPVPERLGKYASILKKRWVLNVDHHRGNINFGTVNVVFPSASSTGEILWSLLDQLSRINKTALNREIAKNLYIATLTDTACFTSISTTPRTHRMISTLLDDFKISFTETEKIRDYFFGNRDKSKTLLTSKALGTLNFYNNDTITIMRLSQADFKDSDTAFEDSVGIVDQGLNIAGVQIAAIFIEKADGSFHVSIRTKGDINANSVAELFGGGGHKNMGAFQFTGNLVEKIEAFIKGVKEFLGDNVGGENNTDPYYNFNE